MELSREYILGLKSSKLLDSLVHESIFKECAHTLIIDRGEQEEYSDYILYRCKKCGEYFQGLIYHENGIVCPDYSNNMNEAWEVFNYIIEHNLYSKRKRFFNELQSLTSEHLSDENITVAYPDVFSILRKEMPEAICKAGLLMLL